LVITLIKRTVYNAINHALNVMDRQILVA
jgi:hypothetical protein